MKPNRLKIAAMGDLHVRAQEHHATEYRDVFAELSEKADVLLLCGDLTDTGLPEEAERLADNLSAAAIPVFAVLGNHDYHSGNPSEIKKILGAANVFFLDDEPRELQGIGFAGTKGFGGGFGNHVIAAHGEEATKQFVEESLEEVLRLENSIRKLSTRHMVIALHYAPISQTVKGESPEIFPFLGSSRLAEVIERFDVDAVFHGHAHHGTYKGATAGGIPVYNCAIELVRKHEHKPYVLIEIPAGKK